MVNYTRTKVEFQNLAKAILQNDTDYFINAPVICTGPDPLTPPKPSIANFYVFYGNGTSHRVEGGNRSIGTCHMSLKYSGCNADKLFIGGGDTYTRDTTTPTSYGSCDLQTLSNDSSTTSVSTIIVWWLLPASHSSKYDQIYDAITNFATSGTIPSNIWENPKTKRPNTAPIYLNDHNFRHPIYEPLLARKWRQRKSDAA